MYPSVFIGSYYLLFFLFIGRGPQHATHNLAAASYTERYRATLVLAKPVPHRRSPLPHPTPQLVHFRCTQQLFTAYSILHIVPTLNNKHHNTANCKQLQHTDYSA